ncbi:MAG: NTP transferase domain-containing protein [Muribaculaceae bacterium]|nr:NTP transferase domain-containing protein [Muribaculaceae bacterium]
MKGFILAAGFGTRLKPWTDSHPKALFPVDGKPMLGRVIEKMQAAGIADITVNCHHFADQIIDYIGNHYPEVKVIEEEGEPLETGGALLNARPLLDGDEPILVHNVDILSNADFRELEKVHHEKGGIATLLVSDRDSSRKLIFSPEMRLRGWHSLKDKTYKPADFCPSGDDREYAFSGIYIVAPEIFESMQKNGWKGKFPIMEFFLSTLSFNNIRGYCQCELEVRDIGKSRVS